VEFYQGKVEHFTNVNAFFRCLSGIPIGRKPRSVKQKEGTKTKCR
jgi:hypothetical protein